MTLGKKIASSLGAVLAIMAVIAVISITAMNEGADNASRMDKQYAPQIEIISEIQTPFVVARVNAIKFIYTENDKFLANATAALEGVHKGIDRAIELSKEYPNLTGLKKNIALIHDEIQSYEKSLKELDDASEARKAINKQLDKDTIEFNETMSKYLAGQHEQMDNDIVNQLSVAKLRERVTKVYNTYEVIMKQKDGISAVYKSTARRDANILEEGLNQLKELEGIFTEIKSVTRKASDMTLLNALSKLANKMLHDLEKLEEYSKSMESIDADMGVSGGHVTKYIAELNEAGLGRITSLSQVSDVSLNNAVNFMIIASIIALLIGLALSFFMTRSINKAITTAVASIMDANNQVVNASNEISDSSQTLAEGASRQASSVEEVSATIEESTSINTQNAGNSREADVLAKETKDAAEVGYQKGAELMKAMEEINASSEKISKIIKTIDEIASQTKLLALNAAVEAARAGEHGLGFAVVADEVKSLAGRSADAATETANIIEESIRQAKNGSEISQQTSEAFSDILEKIKKTSNLIGEISISAKEQSEGMNQISGAMGEIDQITQQNAATSEEAAAAAEELNAQAISMKETVKIIGDMVGFVEEGSAATTSKPAPKRLTVKPQAKQSRVAPNKPPRKEESADDVFPLDEDDLKEF